MKKTGEPGDCRNKLCQQDDKWHDVLNAEQPADHGPSKYGHAWWQKRIEYKIFYGEEIVSVFQIGKAKLNFCNVLLLFQPLQYREDVPEKAKKIEKLGVWNSEENALEGIIQLATAIESGR